MRRWMFWALLSVAGYYAVFGGEYSLLDVQRIRFDTEDARVTLVNLRAETESLTARADSLENDPRTLETLARERFGMIRDGEVLYRFADQDGAPEPELEAGQSP